MRKDKKHRKWLSILLLFSLLCTSGRGIMISAEDGTAGILESVQVSDEAAGFTDLEGCGAGEEGSEPGAVLPEEVWKALEEKQTEFNPIPEETDDTSDGEETWTEIPDIQEVPTETPGETVVPQETPDETENPADSGDALTAFLNLSVEEQLQLIADMDEEEFQELLNNLVSEGILAVVLTKRQKTDS